MDKEHNVIKGVFNFIFYSYFVFADYIFQFDLKNLSFILMH